MSLGDKGGAAEVVLPDCLANDYVALGWSIASYEGCEAVADIQKRLVDRGYTEDNLDYAGRSLNSFVNQMKVGDIVVVSDGNLKLKAIARVTGDYEYIETDVHDYFNRRPVEWMTIFDPSISYERLMNSRFIQKTIYELKEPSIDLEKLRRLLVSDQVDAESGTRLPYVMIIDEINRGNIANIFGELITLIEPSKREGRPEALAVTLPYSKERFSVPENLYLIGTMNTADRSLVHVDSALRRRFTFEEKMPDLSELDNIRIEGVDVASMVRALNQRIELLYDREHTLGHSFFLPLKDSPRMDLLAQIMETEIFPLLEEYFFEDWSRIRQVLGDHLKTSTDTQFFIEKYTEDEITNLLGSEEGGPISPHYKRNPNALEIPAAYIGVYQTQVS